MLIENVDALKQWLVQKLSPICDAEPSALAKYVCALVRKDKPEAELKEICNDQLDVFLQLKTKTFVEELFEGLRSKVYETSATNVSKSAAPTPVPTPSSTPSHTPSLISVKSELVTVKTTTTPPLDYFVTQSQSFTDNNSQPKFSQSAESNIRRIKKEEEVQPWVNSPIQVIKQEPFEVKQERDRDIRDGQESRDNRDKDLREDRDRRDNRDLRISRDGRELERRDFERRDIERRDSRENRDRRRRTRSRSLSPRRRDVDDRRRRYDDRSRYSPDRRYRRKSWSRSPRRFRVSPDRMRGRSRSPRERDLREKLNRHSSRSWSRPRSRTRSPHSHSRSRSRGQIEPDSRGSTPTQDNGLYPAITSSSSSLPSIITVPIKGNEPPPPGEGPPLIMPGPGVPVSTGPGRLRCQNFDEKGFCMLGDLCPFDHGNDPVVVEDIGIPNVLSFPPPPPGMPLPPPVSVTMNIPPPRAGFPPPRGMHLAPPGIPGPRMMHLRPPPVPPLPPSVEPYQPEGYNPEAPGITRQPYWAPPPPPPGPSMPMGVFQPDSRNTPPPKLRQRDLVPVPTIQQETEMELAQPLEPDMTSVSLRTVVPAKRTHAEMEDSSAPVVQRAHFNPRYGYGTLAGKRPFDFNRLGGFNRQAYARHENTTLEVRKIPAEFNNIAKLNEHFAKFGNLTNIQVNFEGDPSAALISFSRNEEAARAYHSSEPVFNNRFIKLFWHRQSESSGGGDNSASKVPGGIQARLGPINQESPSGFSGDATASQSQHSPTDGVSSTSTDAGLKSSATNRAVAVVIPPAHKLSLNNTVKSVSQPVVEKSIVYTTSLGNLKKTVFSPQIPRTKVAMSPVASPTAVKSADFVSRIEAIKKNEELKKEAAAKKAELEKQKQVLLEKQIVQQKVLLDKLEKGKGTMTLEERTNLIKMLKVVSDSIDKLKFSKGTPTARRIASSSSMRLVNVSSAAATGTMPSPASASAQQTKKEILDMELELITKEGAGEDTTALRRKLAELTRQASSMGLIGRGRGRGRGAALWTGGSRGRGLKIANSMSLDNRPKTLEVRGFDLEELEEVKTHLSTFGQIIKTEIKENIPCAMITFFNRKQAELAYMSGNKFRKKTLTIRWYFGVVRTVSAESIEVEDEEDEDIGEDEVKFTRNNDYN